MQTYYVWITALTEAYADELIGRLVAHNWRIAPLSKNLVSASDAKISCLITFSMVKPTQSSFDPDKGLVLEEVKDTMKLLGMRAFSVIVTHGVESTWTSSNVFKPVELNLEEIHDDETEEAESSDKVVH